MLGPGSPYDRLCALVRTRARARGVILCVIGGQHGSGFAAQIPPEEFPDVVGILRDVADDIARDGIAAGFQPREPRPLAVAMAQTLGAAADSIARLQAEVHRKDAEIAMLRAQLRAAEDGRTVDRMNAEAEARYCPQCGGDCRVIK